MWLAAHMVDWQGANKLTFVDSALAGALMSVSLAGVAICMPEHPAAQVPLGLTALSYHAEILALMVSRTITILCMVLEIKAMTLAYTA